MKRGRPEQVGRCAAGRPRCYRLRKSARIDARRLLAIATKASEKVLLQTGQAGSCYA